MFVHPPFSSPTVAQVAHLTLAAFEREYWAGHRNSSLLAAALLKTATDHFFPVLGPPVIPTLPADQERQRLFCEALTAWTQLHYARSRFHELITHLEGQQPTTPWEAPIEPRLNS